MQIGHTFPPPGIDASLGYGFAPRGEQSAKGITNEQSFSGEKPPEHIQDDADRRPSHADRRNALRRQCLENDFQREVAAAGLGRKNSRLWARLLKLAI